MPVLLISLGTSWPIVPEAFHALPPGPTGFSSVHVLTSASPSIDAGIVEIKSWFATHQPEVALSFSRVHGFHEPHHQEDQRAFDEVLYRWMLEKAPCPEDRYVCLAGGFKTMASSMQRSASLFGAADVFHVLADRLYPNPRGPNTLREAATAVEVDDSLSRRAVHYVRLGPESGWPQLRSLSIEGFPLAIARSDKDIRFVTTNGLHLSERIDAVLHRAHRIDGSWEKLPELPFVELATWSEKDLAWLREPLQPADPHDCRWVKALPKVELHCHLGGFATEGDLLHQVRSAALHPAKLPPLHGLSKPLGWPLPPSPIGLEPYRRLGDNNGSSLLRDPGCLHRQCTLLYRHLLEQRVLYAEIRCSPANYANSEQGRSPWEVLTEIRNAFDEAADEARRAHASGMLRSPPCIINLIIIGTRQNRGDYRSAISRHLSLAVTASEHWSDTSRCRIVGVDLAGYEDISTRAHYYREEFTAVHRCGLALTVHAGENDDSEGVWRAVFDLNARRLGHGLTLAQSPELLRSVAARGIGVEMCPYANLQIRGYPLCDDPQTGTDAPATLAVYPLLDYLRAGIAVSVNTDNPGISAATLGDNLLLAARLCPGLTRLDLLRLQRNALDTAFISPRQRQKLVAASASVIPTPVDLVLPIPSR